MQIQNTADLRKFLCASLIGIKNGDLDIAKASQITKMSEQIIGSLYVEMKAQALSMQMDKGVANIGALQLIEEIKQG